MREALRPGLVRPSEVASAEKLLNTEHTQDFADRAQ